MVNDPFCHFLADFNLHLTQVHPNHLFAAKEFHQNVFVDPGVEIG